MKGLFSILMLSAFVCSICAATPDDYYSSLDGKKGSELMAAVRNLAAAHRVVTYNTKTWKAFENTDVRYVKGRPVWWDMYSNNIVYLPAHASLNIEHSVPNSWWGGKSASNEAFSDLFHLNPSDQNSNNKKGNYPPGEVADPRLLDNGLFKIGTPVSGQGGGAQNVFEPADEYKGDFARAYFYIFSSYGDISWLDDHSYIYDSNASLKDWAVELLLRWHRRDPVDSKEIDRNEAIFAEQGNRNPFIDCPDLAEYLWGNRCDRCFSADFDAPGPLDRPKAPEFKDVRLTAIDTYAGRWWDGRKIEINAPEGDLYLSIDGDPYKLASEIILDPADNGGENHFFSAYSVKDTDSHTLRSPIARLTMTARDPMVADYSAARWERVVSDEGLDLSAGYYIIISAHNFHAMSVNGGSSSSAFMETAGFVEVSNDFIIELPVEAALVSFEKTSNNKLRLAVRDIYGNYIGSWNATAKNKMRLDPVLFTPGAPRINADGTFSFTFDQFGSLQYNASQPRFLNYESAQQPVYLYRFKDLAGGWSEIGTLIEDLNPGIAVDRNSIAPGPGTPVFDLSGRPVRGDCLSPGVYIVITPSGPRKIIL